MNKMEINVLDLNEGSVEDSLLLRALQVPYRLCGERRAVTYSKRRGRRIVRIKINVRNNSNCDQQHKKINLAVVQQAITIFACTQYFG